MVTKLPFTVMALGVDSNEGDVMPPYTLAKGLMIDTKKCLKALKEVVKPWPPLHVSKGRCACAQLEGNPGLVHGEHPEGLAQGGMAPKQPCCDTLDL
jgi:hypothetical protein